MLAARRATMTDTPNTPETEIDTPVAVDDTPPDRLSINQRSPFFQQDLLERGIGIRFKDKVRHDVEEYCISEGWIRVALGKKVDRNGNALTLKLVGPVEAWFERPATEAEQG